MDLSSHKKRLEKIVISNKKFKHMAYIPTLDELERFYSMSRDFFSTEDQPQSSKNGIFFTVKDVFNTYVLPTGMGSPMWKDFKAGNNARVLSMVLNSGFNFLGKTKTSEFAVHAPTPTINPWTKNRIVGTSSSGSVVSVLLNESDISLATQSGASISRPASYCGVIGFKPSFGLIPRTGVLKTCDLFDTIGFFSRSYKKSIKAIRSMSLVGPNYPLNTINHKRQKSVVVGYFKEVDLRKLVDVSDTMFKSYFEFIETLATKDIRVKPLKIPTHFKKIHKSHHIIYTKSLEYYFKNELGDKGKISDSFSKFIDSGMSYSKENFIKELRHHSERIKGFFSLFK